MAYVYLYEPCELGEPQDEFQLCNEVIEQLTQLNIVVEHDEDHDIYRVLFHCEYEAEKTLKDLGLSDTYFDSWYEE